VRVLLERAIRAAVLLFGVSLLSFLLLEAAPGDFFDELRLNRQISPATIAALRAEYGLDAPLMTRYARWVTAALHGHFGYSLQYRVPVERLLWHRAGNTLLLTGVALALAWLLALGVGLATAVTNRRWPDRLAGGFAAALLALPDVLITLVLLSIAAHSGWLPAGGMSSLARGGTLVTVGGTTGFEVALSLLPVFADQLTITGSIMGTLKDMEDMVRLIAQAKIEPEIGVVLPMERAQEAFRAMWEGKTHGKTVFTR